MKKFYLLLHYCTILVSHFQLMHKTILHWNQVGVNVANDGYGSGYVAET